MHCVLFMLRLSHTFKLRLLFSFCINSTRSWIYSVRSLSVTGNWLGLSASRVGSFRKIRFTRESSYCFSASWPSQFCPPSVCLSVGSTSHGWIS